MSFLQTSKFTAAVFLISCIFFQGCTASKTETKAPAPAKVDNRVQESALTQVTLSPQAEQRLGIELAAVQEGDRSGRMSIAGEVMAIPGRALIVTAPVSGPVALARKDLIVGQIVKAGDPIFRLTPMLAAQRDLKTTYEADLQSAKSRLDTAAQQLERARNLLRDLAGSKRNFELADQEYGQAKAGYDAAVTRLKRLETHPLDADVDMTIVAPADGILRQIQAAEGQNVNAGAPLFEVADLRNVWLRVPVYAGDLREFQTITAAEVRDIDGRGRARQARRIAAPPTADPLAVTADLYYELSNTDTALRPGQRLSILLPQRTQTKHGLTVPASAILYDINGGTWVYTHTTPHVYQRQRVELLEVKGASALLARGPKPGVNVVTQGAAELFGTEFGAGH